MGKVEESVNGNVTWVDVEKPTQSDIRMVGDRFKFSQLELDDCLSKRQLQKLEDHSDHLFLIIHCPHISETGHMVASEQVSIFLGSNYLVTVHQGNLRQIGELFQSCKNNKNHVVRNSAGILHDILHALVDTLFPLLGGLMNELEDIEDSVFDENIQVVREITTLRRNISALRRTILPFKRIVNDLHDEIQMRTPELAPNFRDVCDHVEKASAVLDEARETVEIFKDTDFTVNTERSNKILAILTIIFTLSIPGTMMGTFYGMNVPLPGGIETGPWLLLGPYTTLLVILLISLVPPLVMCLYFRRLGWI
jgi:magnesium transporter